MGDDLRKIDIPTANSIKEDDEDIVYFDTRLSRKQNYSRTISSIIINPPSQPANEKKKEEPKSSTNNQGPWNYGIQLLLKKIGEKSGGYKWMNIKEQYYHGKIKERYNTAEVIILAIITTIISSEFVVLVSDSGLENNKAAMVVISGIQILLTLAYTIVRNMKKNGKHELKEHQHRSASAKFSAISTSIQEQLSFSIEDREKDKDFLRSSIKKYNTLLEANPLIREKTMHKYIEGTKDSKIFKPMVVGGFDQIEIVIDPDNSSHNSDMKVKNKDKPVSNKAQYEINRWMRHF